MQSHQCMQLLGRVRLRADYNDCYLKLANERFEVVRIDLRSGENPVKAGLRGNQGTQERRNRATISGQAQREHLWGIADTMPANSVDETETSADASNSSEVGLSVPSRSNFGEHSRHDVVAELGSSAHQGRVEQILTKLPEIVCTDGFDQPCYVGIIGLAVRDCLACNAAQFAGSMMRDARIHAPPATSARRSISLSRSSRLNTRRPLRTRRGAIARYRRSPGSNRIDR